MEEEANARASLSAAVGKSVYVEGMKISVPQSEDTPATSFRSAVWRDREAGTARLCLGVGSTLHFVELSSAMRRDLSDDGEASDAPTPEVQSVDLPHGHEVDCLAWSCHGHCVVAGDANGSIHFVLCAVALPRACTFMPDSANATPRRH